MKLRSFVAATTALGLVAAGGFVSSAKAAVVDADVGGGAAGIQATVRLDQWELFQFLTNNDEETYGAEYSVVTPRVELPYNGGSFTKAALNQTVGPVNVRALRAHIHGNRQGEPFAEASTSLTGVKIQGTDIRAIETYCRWDAANPVPIGSTTIVGAGNVKYNPAPNTEREIPGLGKLILNEQRIDHSFPVVDSTGNVNYAQVIYVFGAHLYLEKEAEDLYGFADIILGFTSCDPIVLPNLSGLKLLQQST